MGGAGSGKSCNIAQDFVCKMLDSNFKNAHLLVVRKVASTHLNSTFAELCAAAERILGDDWTDFFEVKKSPLTFSSRVTGATAIFRGMKDASQREKIKSISPPYGKFCWIWCEEATELDAADFEILDDRLRGILDEQLFYQITLSFNPISASHWLKARFFDSACDDAHVNVSTYKDNIYLDKEFEKHMLRRADRDPQGYSVYALGQWGKAEGQIITHFEVVRAECSADKFDSLAFGSDFGFNHPHATVLLGFCDGSLFVCDEWVAREKDTEEISAAMFSYFSSRWHSVDLSKIIMWCDSAEPDRIRTLRRLGWSARAAKKGKGSVMAQIDWIQTHPLFVFDNCSHTIAELQNWRWEKDPDSGLFLDRPVNSGDDAIAAIRYGIESWRSSSKFSFA